MKKLILLLVAALALAPGSALAHSRAKVYKGTFDLVGADGDYVTGNFGKVQLVDGKRNDKLSVHVRRLGSRAKYLFRLQQAPKTCDATAPAGTDVPGWTYRRGGVLTTSKHGVANSTARSRTFTAQPGVKYFVGVYQLTPSGGRGELVLCADLRTKSHGAGKPGKHDEPHRGTTPAQGNGQGQGHGADNPGRGHDKHADPQPDHGRDHRGG